MKDLCISEQFLVLLADRTGQGVNYTSMETMWISAIYVCPVRGLAGLTPPDPVVLGRAAKTGRGLGLDRLVIPVLEESLLKAERHRVRFLDGLIRCLDQAEDAGMFVQLMSPAQRILGVDWVVPYLVRGGLDLRAAPVFVDGAMRTLRPFAWWADPSIVRRRLACFGELTAALSGHPALGGWMVMDRVLDWPRPDAQMADLILKSFCAQIRERDEKGRIDLCVGVSELMDPSLIQGLAGQVDGLCLRGIEASGIGWIHCRNLGEEISLMAYLGSMARWLLQCQVTVEMGRIMTGAGIREEDVASVSVMRRQEISGITWVNWMDPGPHLLSEPPWNLRGGVEGTGLLDREGDPKEGVETFSREIRLVEQGLPVTDFIDIDQKAYMDDPEVHLRRLWDHFREATG